MELFGWLALLMVFIIGISYFPYWGTALQLMFVRFAHPGQQEIARSELPDEVRQSATDYERQLLDLGFECIAVCQARSSVFDFSSPLYNFYFIHPAYSTLAILGETPYPGAINPFQVVFVTELINGNILQTTDNYVHSLLKLPSTYQLQDGYFGDVSSQWQLHISKLELNPLVASQWRPQEFEQRTAQQWLLHIQQKDAELFEYWLKERVLYALVKDAYFIHPRYALRYAKNFIDGQKKTIATLQTRPQPSVESVRLGLKRQILFQKTGNNLSKFLLFSVSLVVFYLSFGLVFSWVLVPMIIVVLLIHELGHCLAMKLFGYQNTQILFVPLLGAATIGTKTNVPVWQEILVLLAGPVPGLMFGWLLIQQTDAQVFFDLVQLGWIFIIINLINLLPMTPLDGGQIVNKLYFQKYPVFGFGFSVLSILLFLGLAIVSKDAVLFMVAVLFSLSLKFQWQMMLLVRALSKTVCSEKRTEIYEKQDAALTLVSAEFANHPRQYIFAKRLHDWCCA